MAAKKGRAKTSSKAKPRSKAKAMTLIPANRYLRYHLTTSGTPGTETSHFIDLARDLGRSNRRLYRQGRDYHIKKVTIISSDTPNGGNRVSLSTMGGGWVSQMAWKRGFQTWTKMNKEAQTQTAGQIAGTWADFKVYLSNTMRSGDILDPIDNGSVAYLSGDWDYSELISPENTTTGDAFYLHMLGAHSGGSGSRISVGLIKSYGESRATVQSDDPNVPSEASDDPLVNVFNYGETVQFVLDDLEGQNDSPPYDIASYPGDDLNASKPIVVQDTTIVDGRSSLGSFTARCGLIEVEVKSPLPNDVYSLLFELAPGKYRGIKAESF